MSSRYQAGIVLPGYNPLLVPDAPTIGTATGGNASASVAFTAPANVGGGAITGYAAVSTPGGFTGSGASSPITVSGLSNGTAYTFKVRATNAYGTSPLSAASSSVVPEAPPTVIGQPYGGGYYAGQIGVSSVATHYLVVGPKASAEVGSTQFKTTSTNDSGATSDINGPSNSSSMNNASHPAAQFCEAVTTGGYTDWYLPAKNELEVCYYNLKPYNNSNNTSVATNPNAVPARASNYTAGNPAQTSAAAFRVSGGEDFNGDKYWSSTQRTAAYGWPQSFYTGYQNPYEQKYFPRWVRAIRRVAV